VAFDCQRAAKQDFRLLQKFVLFIVHAYTISNPGPMSTLYNLYFTVVVELIGKLRRANSPKYLRAARS
jgi:hypothetical protein